MAVRLNFPKNGFNNQQPIPNTMKPILSIAIIFLAFLSQNRVFANEPSNDRVWGKTKPIQTTMQQDTLTIHQYGEKIAQLLSKNDWPAILKEIHAIHMPEEWEEMIKPSFEAYFGKELSIEVIPFETLPDYQLKWLNKAPKEVLAKTKWAVRLNYDNSTKDETDKGKLELAVFKDNNGDCSILVVGGEG